MLKAIIFDYCFFYVIVLSSVIVPYTIFLKKYYNNIRGIGVAIVVLIMYNSCWGFFLGRVSLVKELNSLDPNTISKIEIYDYKPQDRRDTLILVKPGIIEKFSLSMKNSHFILMKKPKTTFKKKFIKLIFKNKKDIELLSKYDDPNGLLFTLFLNGKDIGYFKNNKLLFLIEE